MDGSVPPARAQGDFPSRELSKQEIGQVGAVASGWVLQFLAARPAIHEAMPTATKNSTAVQACGSASLVSAIANAIVAAAMPHKTAITMQPT